MAKGVHKIESEVFHFPEIEYVEGGLSDFYKPHHCVLAPPGGPSLTRQEFAEECDVNEIMRRYEHTGVLPAVGEPIYHDFTAQPDDLMGHMKLMQDASEAFMTLPARVRREFDNDPVQFVEYASNPDNIGQMREWGLAKPKDPDPVKPPPQEVVIVQGGPQAAPAVAPATSPAPAPAGAPAGS